MSLLLLAQNEVCHALHSGCFYPVLYMEIVLRHVNLSMSGQTLDGLQRDALNLELADSGAFVHRYSYERRFI